MGLSTRCASPSVPSMAGRAYNASGTLELEASWLCVNKTKFSRQFICPSMNKDMFGLRWTQEDVAIMIASCTKLNEVIDIDHRADNYYGALFDEKMVVMSLKMQRRMKLALCQHYKRLPRRAVSRPSLPNSLPLTLTGRTKTNQSCFLHTSTTLEKKNQLQIKYDIIT